MAFRQQQSKVLLQKSSRLIAEQGSITLAESFAHRAIDLDSNEGYAWFYYGTSLYLQQEFPEAIKAFNAGIPVLPHSYNALRLLAFSSYRMHDYKTTAENLADYLTMIPMPPVTPELVFRMAGLSFLRLGNLADSNYYLLHATQLANDEGDLFRVRATVSLLCSQIWSADYCFRAFRFYLPNKEFNPFELVSNALAANKLDVTIKFLSSVHERTVKDVSLVKALAGAYKSAGNNDKAGETLAEGIKETPNNPDLHLMYGDILYNEKKLPQAFQQYDEHLKLEPESPFRKAILQRKAVSRF